MKINWKIRFKNKVWLRFFIAAVLGLVYKALATFGIVPKIEQQALMDLFDMLLGVLLLLGVVVDPTTKGMEDSDLAMTYTHPKDNSQKGENRPVANDKAINYEDIKEGLKDAEVLEDGR